MTPTEHPAPTMTITLDYLDGAPTVLLEVLDLHRAAVLSIDDVVINRIPIEFTVSTWYADHYKQWICGQQSDVRRTDGNTSQPATGNQRQRLFSAITIAMRTVPATFLLDGQTAQLGRNMERAQERVDSVREELVERLTELRIETTAYETAVLARS